MIDSRRVDEVIEWLADFNKEFKKISCQLERIADCMEIELERSRTDK